MRVFLSWSKDRSQKVAEEFHSWIQCVNQKIKPFFSPKDLSGGLVWINELNSQLSKTNAGIIFLTPENQHEAWIQFEAGALAKGFSSNRVFVLLIDMDPKDVKGPLSSFNLSVPDKEGIRKLIFDLNDLLDEEKLEPLILNKVLAKYYDDLDQAIKTISSIKPKKKEEPAPRASEDIQEEMLNILRNLSNRVANIESSQKAEIIRPLSENKNYDMFNDYWDNDIKKPRLFPWTIDSETGSLKFNLDNLKNDSGKKKNSDSEEST